MDGTDEMYTEEQCTEDLLNFAENAGLLERFFSVEDLKQIASRAPPKLEKWYQTLKQVERAPEVDIFTAKEAEDYAFQLLRLALYDIHVLVDNSGSMKRGNRMKILREQLHATVVLDNAFIDDADEATGVRIHLLHGKHKKEIVKNTEQLNTMWDTIKFGGGTPLGTVLKNKVWMPIVSKKEPLKKPSLVYILTDGEPTDEPDEMFCNSIVECKEELAKKNYPASAIAFGIVQIGDSKDATDFLKGLARDARLIEDDGRVRHLDVSHAAKEFIDAVKLHPELRAKTTSALLLRNFLGSIDATVRDEEMPDDGNEDTDENA